MGQFNNLTNAPDQAMWKTLPLGTKVKITGVHWGCGGSPNCSHINTCCGRLYDDKIINMYGEVVDHEDDFYTPPNIIRVLPAVAGQPDSYFLAAENLEVI